MELAGEKLNKNSPTNKVSDMVLKLSSILRYSLEQVDSTVPLSTELEHAKNFMDLQSIRYGHLFHVEWYIAPNTLSCRVIKFILQPILENAIKHGILPSSRTIDGLISIESRVNEEYLFLIVTDNGSGITRLE